MGGPEERQVPYLFLLELSNHVNATSLSHPATFVLVRLRQV